ncbi:hypothetical protein LTR86_010976 [Recurvomyces mirabilis]|nr:hypothetical protein LTR86_010976 [Recurvomyces mirabilis]
MPEVQTPNSTSLPALSDFINGAPPSSMLSHYDAEDDLFPQPMLDFENGLVQLSNQTSPGTETNTQHSRCDTDLIGTIQSLSGQTATQAAAYTTLVHAHEALVRDSIQSDQNRNAAISHTNMLQDQLRQAQCSLASYYTHFEELRRDITSKNETIKALRDYNNQYAKQQAELTRALLDIAQFRSSQDTGHQSSALWHSSQTSVPNTLPISQSYLPEVKASTTPLNTPMQPAATLPSRSFQSVNYVSCYGHDSMLPPLAPRAERDQAVVSAPKEKARAGKKAKGQ